jgi:hypothetical protein
MPPDGGVRARDWIVAPLTRIKRLWPGSLGANALLRCVSLETPEILNHVGGGSERRERVAKRKAAFHPHATAPHWSERHSTSPPSWCLAWSARLELRLRTSLNRPDLGGRQPQRGLGVRHSNELSPSRVRRDEPAVAHLQPASRPLARGRRRPVPAHRAMMQRRFAFQSWGRQALLV